MKSIYIIFRFFLYPIIFVADFLQNKFTSIFVPMNMGPVSEDNYSLLIKKNINQKYFVLDFGCGVGFFSRLFNPNKYLGVDVNLSFIKNSKIKNPNYKFRVLKKNYLKNYEKKINFIFINNVLHHLTDKQIINTFIFFKKNLKKKNKIFNY